MELLGTWIVEWPESIIHNFATKIKTKYRKTLSRCLNWINCESFSKIFILTVWRFIRRINETFSNVASLQVLMGIFATYTSIVRLPGDLETNRTPVVNIFYFSGMLTMIFLYCWCKNMILSTVIQKSHNFLKPWWPNFCFYRVARNRQSFFAWNGSSSYFIYQS